MFVFIDRVDKYKGNLTTIKRIKYWHFECQPFVRGIRCKEGLINTYTLAFKFLYRLAKLPHQLCDETKHLFRAGEFLQTNFHFMVQFLTKPFN